MLFTGQWILERIAKMSELNEKMLNELRKANRKKTNHVLHLLLSVLTAGLWLPVWFLVAFKNSASNRARGL